MVPLFSCHVHVYKAYKRGVPSGQTYPENCSLQSWSEEFKGYSRMAVKAAVEQGTFTALRYLRFCIVCDVSYVQEPGGVGFFLSRGKTWVRVQVIAGEIPRRP